MSTLDYLRTHFTKWQLIKAVLAGFLITIYLFCFIWLAGAIFAAFDIKI